MSAIVGRPICVENRPDVPLNRDQSISPANFITGCAISIVFISCIPNSSSSRSIGFFGGIEKPLVVSSGQSES